MDNVPTLRAIGPGGGSAVLRPILDQDIPGGEGGSTFRATAGR